MTAARVYAARLRPRVPLLIPFYVLAAARSWRDELGRLTAP